MLAWLAANKPYFETAYFLASTLLVGSLIFGAIQLRLVKKDMKDRGRRAAAEKSIDFLDRYAEKIIPAVDKYITRLDEELPNRADMTSHHSENFFIDPNALDKAILINVIVRQNCGVIQILNELESFSVAVMERVVIDDILFTPISKNFTQFIAGENLTLSVLRFNGTPYKNLLDLHLKWSDRIEVNKFKLQKQDAEHNISKKGDRHKSEPPIGF